MDNVRPHNSDAEGITTYHLELLRSISISSRRVSHIPGVLSSTSSTRETVVTRSTTTGRLHVSPIATPVRQLSRPVLTEVDLGYLYSLDPSFLAESVPPTPEYIRDMLAGMPMMVPYDRVSSHYTVLPPKIRMTLPHNDGTVCPTHILALPTSQQGKYYLLPIHELVFASNCSQFPRLPCSEAANPPPEHPIFDSVDLPVVLCRSPSPEYFDLFRKYLYRKDLGLLRSAFLPAGWDESMESVLRQRETVHGFWLNAYTFGLYDFDMGTFDLIDECWGLIHRVCQRILR